MLHGVLYCLNLILSMPFKVGFRSPVTFKMKLSVTTVKNSSQLLPFFGTKIPIIKCRVRKIWKLTLLDPLKMIFRDFSYEMKLLEFNIKWTKWSQYQLNDIDCEIIVDLCVVYLVKSHNHLVSWNLT